MIILTPEHVYIDSDTDRVFPGVTSVIKDAGLMGYMPGDEWYLERGTAVHEATALWDRGVLDEDSLDPQIAPFLASWKQYRADTGFAPKLIEEIFVDPIFGYAGTIDRDGLDIKSGSPAKWYVLQNAAYWHSPIVNKGPWQTVFLRENGSYKVVVYAPQELYEAFQVFTAALTLNAWKTRNGLLK